MSEPRPIYKGIPEYKGPDFRTVYDYPHLLGQETPEHYAARMFGAALAQDWGEMLADAQDERVRWCMRMIKQQHEAIAYLTGILDNYRVEVDRLNADMQRVMTALDLRRGPGTPTAAPATPPKPSLPSVLP